MATHFERGTLTSMARMIALFSSAALGSPGILHAQQDQGFDAVEIGVLHVQGSVYMLVGAGGNTTVQVGNDGVLVVDTQFEGLSDELIAAIRQLSDQPIRYVVNTHGHPDHTGGNASIALAGSALPVAAGRSGARIVAHENVLIGMRQLSDDAFPLDGWPTDTFHGEKKEVFFNGEAIELIHQPAAHTDGDSIVFFRRSDVISTGDVFVTTSYPVIDLRRGGSVQGVVDALNRILEMAIPEHMQEGGTMIIPGHGRLCDEADLVEYRDMVTIIRDRIQDMIAKGMSLRQIRAAEPTFEFDARYGADTGPWTTGRFIEAVYRDLSASAADAR